MPIEEITLSVPKGVAEPQPGSASRGPNRGGEATGSAEVNKLAAAYAKSARARDRFTFTNAGRLRNRERFSQSLKAIVKKIATDASGPVQDRATRMRIRTQIYVEVMQLAEAMSRDQLKMIRWARLRLRWSLAVAAMGLLGITATLIMNDVISWPYH